MQLHSISEVSKIPPTEAARPVRVPPERRAEVVRPESSVQQAEGADSSRPTERVDAKPAPAEATPEPLPFAPAHGALAQLAQALEKGDLEGVEQAFLALRLQRSTSSLSGQNIHLTA